MLDCNDILAFEQSRSKLLGLAYRILGSWADAEDAVQDTFLKWQRVDRRLIENPVSWLTTACTRRCIDMLRAPNRARVDYVGPWLPEPIQTATSEYPEDGMALASTLSTAFLLMLERLTPKERAAYLLHDIFEMAYPEIAQTLGLQKSTCPVASSSRELARTLPSPESGISLRLLGRRNCLLPSRLPSAAAVPILLQPCCRTRSSSVPTAAERFQPSSRSSKERTRYSHSLRRPANGGAPMTGWPRRSTAAGASFCGRMA